MFEPIKLENSRGRRSPSGNFITITTGEDNKVELKFSKDLRDHFAKEAMISISNYNDDLYLTCVKSDQSISIEEGSPNYRTFPASGKIGNTGHSWATAIKKQFNTTATEFNINVDIENPVTSETSKIIGYKLSETATTVQAEDVTSEADSSTY